MGFIILSFLRMKNARIAIQDAVREFKTYEFKTLEELENLALSSLSLKALKFLV